MPFDNKLVVDIVVHDPLTSYNGGNRQWHGHLPEGYQYYLETAYIAPDTTLAVATGNTQSYTLVDEDGNTIGTVAAGAALAVGGTTFASYVTAYRWQDCTSAQRSFYLKMNLSGTGATPPRMLRVVTTWSVKKGGAAGD